MPTIGIIGAGRIGGTVARVAAAHGYPVLISNSRGPQSLTAFVDGLGAADVRAVDVEAVGSADLVLLAIPFSNRNGLPVSALQGKVVLDATNYIVARDGALDEIDQQRTTSSELVQAQLAGSYVVKAFNSIGAAELVTTAMPSGTHDRRGMALTGDHADAKALVSSFIDVVGFDPVDLGALAEGWRFDPGSSIFVAHLTAEQIRSAAVAEHR